MTWLVACGLVREAAILRRPGWRVVAGGGDAARLEHALEEAARAGVSAVLSCGIAGALDPSLRVGDVVLGTLPGSEPDAALLARLERCLPHARRGTIVGADAIVANVAHKTRLYEATGALAVDLESHVAARVAARHGLPFAVVRTISDAADRALPPAALVGMRPDGGVALGAVLRSLARHPGQLRDLIRTARDARAAFAALERTVVTLS